MIPKFRVFEKDRKIMCEVEELGFGENEDLQKVHYYWEEYGEYLSTSEIDDVILMQSTGLKDKNGVEIFEGDEIELTHSDLEGETIYSKAIAKAPMDYTLEEAVALNYAHEIELTGKNIYENTELLEVAE